MGLSDGPLIVGYEQIPPAAEKLGKVYQIQSGVVVDLHSEFLASHQISFIEACYWATDGKVYIVGSDKDLLANYTHGVVWTWDGTSLTQVHVFPATVAKDDYTVTCIAEFGGALYVGAKEYPGATASGGRVWRLTTPGGAWTEVHNFLAPSEGPVFLKELQGQLFVVYSKRTTGPPVPASFYYSSTGDLGSWVAGPWVNGGVSTVSPRHIFWDGSQWVYEELASGFPASLNRYTASALGGPWSGPTIWFGVNFLGRPYQGPGGDWFLVLPSFAGSLVTKWNPAASSWDTYRSEAFAFNCSAFSAPSIGGAYGGSVYVPIYSPKTNGGGHSCFAKDTDPAVLLPDPDWAVPCAFVPTPVGPSAWDVLEIEPSDWGSGPFCDETVSGNVVVTPGSDIEIIGDQGLDTPSYYELQLGPTCPDLPDDWDAQFELEIVSLPRLKDDDGTRITIWVHDVDLGRKTMIGLSKQGVSVYKMDEYSDSLSGSEIALDDGDAVTLKLTGLGSDPLHRSYLAVEGSLVYRRGFENFYKTGATNTIRIEAVGSPEIPASVKVKAIRVRTHAFSSTDPLSINNIRPKAVIG